MLDAWFADVVGRMHRMGIKRSELAEESGYSVSYLSSVLNGHKGDNNTKKNILEALERLESKKNIGDEPKEE